MIAELIATPRTVPSLAPAAIALVPATPASPAIFSILTGPSRISASPSATMRAQPVGGCSGPEGNDKRHGRVLFVVDGRCPPDRKQARKARHYPPPNALMRTCCAHHVSSLFCPQSLRDRRVRYKKRRNGNLRHRRAFIRSGESAVSYRAEHFYIDAYPNVANICLVLRS